jgi:hypothetical protein
MFLWQDGTLCDSNGLLDCKQFTAAMRNQLRQYAGRRISDYLYHGHGGEAEIAQVHGMGGVWGVMRCWEIKSYVRRKYKQEEMNSEQGKHK